MFTPQQEQTLRLQARARGYDKAKEDAYVEFVRNKTPQAPQAEPTQPEKKGDGFLKSLAKSAVSPFVRVGASAYQATKATGDILTSGVFKLTGDKERAERYKQQAFQGAFAKEQNVPGFGAAKTVNVENPLDAAGVGAELASNFVGAEGAGGLVKNSLGGLVKQGAIQGAKTGLVSGGLYGAGSSLQKDDPTLGGVIKDTATGALTGAAIGGAAGAITGGAGALYNKVKSTPIKQNLIKREVENLTKKYDELFTGTKSSKKALMKSEKFGKAPSKFLAERGYIVDVEHGKINAQPVMQKIRQEADIMEELYEQLLREKDRQLHTDHYIDLGKLGLRVKAKLNTPGNKSSGNLSEMYAEVDKMVNELKKQFGDRINLSTLNSIKRGQWAQSSVFDATKPVFSKDVNYNFGRAAKEILEDSIDEADIKGLNSFLGDHYDALTMLGKVDGNAVKGGRLGGYFARTIGAVAGAKAGPIGSLTGAITGDTVSQIMQANYISNPVKRLILSRIPKTNPIYDQAQRALMGLKIGQKTLPAPRPGAPNKSIHVPINQPSKVIKPGTEAFKGKGALSRVNDYLNETTPGLSTKNVSPFAGELDESLLAGHTAQTFSKQPVDPSALFPKGNGTPKLYKQGSLADEAAKFGTNRPTHQIAIENALNAGDITKAKEIIEKLPAGDPYKKSMQEFVKSYVGKANDALNSVTPGLSTKVKYTVTYTDKNGKKVVMKALEKGDLQGWLRWLEENGLKYTVKTAGVIATGAAIKKGSD
jgi:hypothetical protein